MEDILIIGVGGCGNNFVSSEICSKEFSDVTKYAINTEEQFLNRVAIKNKILIGKSLTGGLGVGGNPEIGEKAANDCVEELAKIIGDDNIVFIVAGFGGGTGTGASPIIADIAHKKGLFTIGIFTRPFDFESKLIDENHIPLRLEYFETGLKKMLNNVDIVCIIPNQDVYNHIRNDKLMEEAFEKINEVISKCIKIFQQTLTKDCFIQKATDAKIKIQETIKDWNVDVILGKRYE